MQRKSRFLCIEILYYRQKLKASSRLHTTEVRLIYVKKVLQKHYFCCKNLANGSKTLYLCTVFFIVLDLRLTRFGGSAEPLFLFI